MANDAVIGRLRLLGLPDLSCVTNGQEYAEALVAKLVVESAIPEQDACNKAQVIEGKSVVCSAGQLTTLEALQNGDILTVTDFANGISSFQPLNTCLDFQYKDRIEQATLGVADTAITSSNTSYTSAVNSIAVGNASSCRNLTYAVQVAGYIPGSMFGMNSTPVTLVAKIEYSLNGGPFTTLVQQTNYLFPKTDFATSQDIYLAKTVVLPVIPPAGNATIDTRLVLQAPALATPGVSFSMVGGSLFTIFIGVSN